MRISGPGLHRLIVELLQHHGASPVQAEATARHMVWCEMVGRHNFGIERIAIHLKRLSAGVLNGAAETKTVDITPSVAKMDGGGGFGYCVAEQAMSHAIGLARGNGVGVVAVHDSNFFGAGAFYVNMAAGAGMVGLAFSNSFPKVVAHGGLKPVLGTNPFAFGAPRRNGDHLLFDMATAALAGSTVREHIAAGAPLPEGLAIDESSRPITDPRKVNTGALLPFGGAKGYGLSLMVEILAGVITGAGVGDGVASMYNDFSRNGGNGHFLMALDIRRFMEMEDYYARFDGLAAMLKASGESVLLPGEIRWDNMRRSEVEGLDIADDTWTAMVRLTQQAGTTPPSPMT